MSFRAEIELRGRTATGFEVPPAVVESLGRGKKPKVSVRIGEHTYRSTVAVYDGRFMLPLNATNRSAAKVTAGDTVEVTLELDDAPREVELPDDVAASLAAEPLASERFGRLSYTRRREYADGIAAAKRPETRQRRIDAMFADLRG